MEMNDKTFLYDRYKNVDYLTGDKEAQEPEIIQFKYSDEACEMLKKHINNNSNIWLQADVDVDGLLSTKTVDSFISYLNSNIKVKLMINREKVHGISKNHVDHINKLGNVDLFIVVDSSSNEVENIKNIKCDVLVIDHHELLHNELYGKTADGEYCIISNMCDGENFKSDSRMSACMVCYELLRYLQRKYNTLDILKDRMMYNWVAITLFTDVINNDRLENIYYITKSLSSENIEPCIKTMIEAFDYRYRGRSKQKLDKSFISFSLATLFNGAIRTGNSHIALDIALNRPMDIWELEKFKNQQNKEIEGITEQAREFDRFTVVDTTYTKLSSNYAGLIATKCVDYYKKTSIAYKMYRATREDGTDYVYAKGSFRGCYGDTDYRKALGDLGYFAEGHPNAFGFEIPVENLKIVMEYLVTYESDIEHREYVSVGNVKKEDRGIHHFDNMNELLSSGYVWKIGILNSRISSQNECVNLVVPSNSLELTEEREKVCYYRCMGLERCMAFEKIQTELIYLYIEYSDQIKVYIRNKWR